MVFFVRWASNRTDPSSRLAAADKFLRSGVGVLVLRTLAARGHMNGRGPQA